MGPCAKKDALGPGGGGSAGQGAHHTGEGRPHKGRLGTLRLRTAPTSWGGTARGSLSLSSFLNHPLGIPVIPGSCCGLEWPLAQGHWDKDVHGYFSS